MKKRLLMILLSLTLVALSLSSCTDGFNKTADELSQLGDTENVVYEYDEAISFGECVFEGLPDSNGAYVSYQGLIYYSATKKNSLMDYSELIYKLDPHAKTSEVVYEKRGLANAPAFSIYKDGKIHYSYNYTIFGDSSANVCEYYDIKTGASGTCASLEADSSNYISIENGIFRIVEQKSGSIYYITEELISSSGYGIILENEFEPDISSNENGHILLSYKLSRGKLKKDYLYAVFEYVPRENKLIFQTHFKVENKIKEPDIDLFYVIYE